MRYFRQHFSNGDAQLDGNQFEECTFTNVELRFGATSPVTLTRCSFSADCRWTFTGPAAETVGFMSGMYSGAGESGRILIENTLNQIRSGMSQAGSAPPPFTIKPRIFIGHGRSNDYLLLDQFLGQLGYETEMFESESRAGMTIVEILERVSLRASVAFLIHTAEDEQPSGTYRARQNVVHETGLLQGRLGFQRAIIIREEGTESFSNIAGIQEIRYPPRNMRAAFGEVAATLTRLFPGPGSSTVSTQRV